MDITLIPQFLLNVLIALWTLALFYATLIFILAIEKKLNIRELYLFAIYVITLGIITLIIIVSYLI